MSGIKEAKKGDIAFLANSRYSALVNETKASAVLVDGDFNTDAIKDKSFIVVDNPSLRFTEIFDLMAPFQVEYDSVVNEKSFIGEGVELGKDIHIAPFAVVDKNCAIGDRTVIGAGTYVGQECRIGKNCLIYPNVSIRERVCIGDNVIIHSCAVVGSDGFGFSTVAGVHKKIPQIGTVIIEDDVEIGANVAIDRARFGKTIIHKGTKIDNLVQIAHNVEVGDNSIIVSQSGIAGSTKIGKNVVMAGQSGVNGHISVGDNVIIAARAGVVRSVPKGQVVSGFPAQEHSKTKRVQVVMQRLPELLKKISELEKKIKKLEEKGS